MHGRQADTEIQPRAFWMMHEWCYLSMGLKRTYRELAEEIHAQCYADDLGGTRGDVQERCLKSIEAKALDNDRVLNRDTSDEIGEGNEDHEDPYFRINQSFD